MTGKRILEASNRGYKQFVIKASTREEARDALLNGKPLEIIRLEDTERIRKITADKVEIWVDESADVYMQMMLKATRKN